MYKFIVIAEDMQQLEFLYRILQNHPTLKFKMSQTFSDEDVEINRFVADATYFDHSISS